jgi:NADPH:quinone reductase-like Zn-dependent oxidoreductase
VRASSLDFRELAILQGDYPLPIKPDLIPVSDGAGEVVAVGEGVTRAKVGDRIAAAIFPRWIDGPFALEYAAQLGGSLDGMLTEYAVLPEDAAVRIPDHLSFEEAATLPCAAVTAWNGLCGSAGVNPQAARGRRTCFSGLARGLVDHVEQLDVEEDAEGDQAGHGLKNDDRPAGRAADGDLELSASRVDASPPGRP